MCGNGALYMAEEEEKDLRDILIDVFEILHYSERPYEELKEKSNDFLQDLKRLTK